jgi:hypothetical protein
VAYTSTLFPSGSTHQYELVYADTAVPANRVTNQGTFTVDNFGLYALGGAAPATPSLHIARSANQLVITWPAGLDGYNLESADSIQTPAWNPVSGVTGNSVTVPISGKQQFFRLRR